MSTLVLKTLFIVLFLFSFNEIDGAIQPRTYQNNVSQVLPACDTHYYTYDINPTATNFWFTFEMTSLTAPGTHDITLKIFDESPEKDGKLCVGAIRSCTISKNSAQTSCQAQVNCPTRKGTYYLAVSATDEIQANYTINFIGIDSFLEPKTITLGDNDKSPYTAAGTILGGNLTDSSKETDKIDAFKFTLPKFDTPGSRVRVEFNGTGVPAHFRYDNYYGCINGQFFDQPIKEVTACQFEQTAEKEWYFVTRRSTAFQNYTFKLYVDRPRVITIDKPGNFEITSTELADAGDVINYQFQLPPQYQSGDAPFRLIVKLKSIDNGQIYMELNPRFPPAVACSSVKETCQTTSGCILVLDPCDIDPDFRQGNWFVALGLVQKTRSTTDPVRFTLSVEAKPIPSSALSYNFRHLRSSAYGISDQLLLPLPPANTWVNIHIYVDSSTNRQITGQTARLHVGEGDYVGDPKSCNVKDSAYAFKSQQSCLLSRTSEDIWSCSIQLDPCELQPFYESRRLGLAFLTYKSNEIYSPEEVINYVIEAKYWSPMDDNRLLSDKVVIADYVGAGEYQIYRIPPLVTGQFNVTVSHETILGGGESRAIDVFYVSAGTSIAPSCNQCWDDKNEKVSLQPGAKNQKDYADACGKGLYSQEQYVAIRGSNASLPEYSATPFTVSLKKQSLTNNNKLKVVYPDTVVLGDALEADYYQLEFPREGLYNKALVIKTSAHGSNEDIGVTTELDFTRSSSEYFSCHDNPDTYQERCSTKNTGTGYCAIVVKSCKFEAQNDQRKFIVIIKADVNLPSGSSPILYNFHFELVDQSPQLLLSDVALRRTLERNVYHHYYVDVAASDVGTRGLVIEIFTDEGILKAKNEQLDFYYSGPSKAGLAGEESDCFCKDDVKNFQDKNVFTLSPCALEVGRYKFSIKTSATVYDSFPVQYTIKTTFVDYNIADNLPLDKPQVLTLYNGVSSYVTIQVPPKFYDSDSTTNLLRFFTITARNTDSISTKISAASPSSCGCYDSLPSSTALAACDLPTKQKTIYIRFDVTSTAVPLHPVPFTFLVISNNSYSDIGTLSVTDCSSDKKTWISATVENQFYRHYKLAIDGNLLGAEVLRLSQDNVTDGSISTYSNVDSYAVDRCTGGGCLSKTTFVSVLGSSPKGDVVSYQLSACRTSVIDFPATGPWTGKIPGKGATLTFRLPKSAFQKDTRLFQFIVSADIGGSFMTNLSMRVYSGGCKSCPSSFPEQRVDSCNQYQRVVDDGTRKVYKAPCALFIDYCAFAENWQADYLLDITSANDGERSLTVTLGTKAIEPIAITVGQTKTVSVPRDELRLVKLVLADADVPDLTKNHKFVSLGISRQSQDYIAEAFTTTDSLLSTCPSALKGSVASQSFNSTTWVVSNTPCCVTNREFYLLLFNRAYFDAAEYTVRAESQIVTEFREIAWDATKNSASGQLQVKPYTNDRKDLKIDPIMDSVKINYPGFSDKKGWRVTTVDINANIQLYIANFGIAGPSTSSCYTQNVFGGSIGSKLVLQTCKAPAGGYSLSARSWDATKTDVQNFAFTVENIFPTKLNFGTSNIVNIRPEILTQFELQIPVTAISDSRRIRISVQAQTAGDSAKFYINDPSRFAGNPDILANDDKDCVGYWSDVGEVTVTSTAPSETILRSCAFNLSSYYVGIWAAKPTDNARTTVPVNITFVSETTEDFALVQVGQSTTVSDPATSKNFRFTSAKLATNSVVFYRVLFDNLNNLTANPSVAFDRALICGDSKQNTLRCNPYSDPNRPNADQRCSMVVASCDIYSEADYGLKIATTAPSYTMKIEQITPTITDISLGSSVVTINAHELKILRFSLQDSQFAPGQTFEIRIDGVTCGTVNAFYAREFIPGPGCDGVDATCSSNEGISSTCSLLSLETCDTLTTASVGTHYITLRGIRQYVSANPIKVTVSVTVSKPSVKFIPMYFNERHTLYAEPLPNVSIAPSSCSTPQPDKFGLKDCCPKSLVGAEQNFQAVPTVWVYPLHGAYYLDNFPKLHIELNKDRLDSASIIVTSERPDFCAKGPASQPKERNTLTCYTTGSGCTLDIPVDGGYAKARQIFIYVDRITLKGGESSGDIGNVVLREKTPKIGKLDLLYITNVRYPYSVTEITPTREVKFFKLTLAENERQYFRILHPEKRDEIPDYYARVSVVRLQGGQIQFSNSWTFANPTTQDRCRSQTRTDYCPRVSGSGSSGSGAGAPTLSKCTVSYTYQGCDNGKITQKGMSFFAAKATSTDSSQKVVYAILKLEFYLERVPLDPTKCDSVKKGTTKYYTHSLVAGTEQFYQFTLDGQSNGDAQLRIGRKLAPIPGGCVDGDFYGYDSCTVLGSNNCVRRYRQIGTPQLAVEHLSGNDPEKYYKLNAELISPRIKTLESGVKVSSPSSEVNSTTNCVDNKYTEFYKFVADASTTAFVVEYDAPGQTLYKNKNYLPYRFGQRITEGSYKGTHLHACPWGEDNSGVPGTYYFHFYKEDNSHTDNTLSNSIKVTKLTVTPTDLAVGSSATLTQIKPGDFLVYRITGIAGKHARTPLRITHGTLGGNVKAWLSRKIGDSSCAWKTSNGDVSIQPCEYKETDDSIYLHLFFPDVSSCDSKTITISAQYDAPIAGFPFAAPPVVFTDVLKPVDGTSYEVAPGATRLLDVAVDPLGDEDVFKVRFYDLKNGAISHAVLKSNILSAEVSTCAQTCLTSKTSLPRTGIWSDSLSWLDKCTHCGQGSYGKFFIPVKGEDALVSNENINFKVSVEKTAWINLGDQTNTLKNVTDDAAFYTIPLSRDSGSLLELTVSEGYGVSVYVYTADCDLAASSTPIQLWCFRGHSCQIPLSRRGNFGSYLDNSNGLDSTFSDSRLRVVVKGQGAKYRIRYVQGGATCGASGSSAFCAGLVGSSFGITSENNDEKTDFAQNFFTQFKEGFSCGASSNGAQKQSCACQDLTPTCISRLKEFVCKKAHQPCDGAGFAYLQDVSLCNAIEKECKRTFGDAGFPQYNCTHNFYNGANPWVTADDVDDDRFVPVTESVAAPPPNLLGLWIFLGILGAILLVVLILVFIRLVLPQIYQTPASLQSETAYSSL